MSDHMKDDGRWRGELLDEIRHLRAENEELRKDKARLDLLESMHIEQGSDGKWWVYDDQSRLAFEHDSIRVALDGLLGAMAGEREK